MSRLIPRGRKSAALAVVLLLLAAGSAVAFYLILSSGAGSGSQKLGQSSTPEPIQLSASWTEGLTPGKEAPLTVTAHNQTGQATDIKKLSYSFTVDAGHTGCSPSWFRISKRGPVWEELETGTGTAISVPAGATKTLTEGEAVQVMFIESGTNQSACEGATLTLNLTSTP